jgi:hypothetical protein
MAHGIGIHRLFLALGFQLHLFLFRLTNCWVAAGGGAIATLRHKHAEGLLTSRTRPSLLSLGIKFFVCFWHKADVPSTLTDVCS